MRLHVVMVLLLAWAGSAQAAVEGRLVEYKHGDAVLEGYLAYDAAAEGRRPGILVVHEWKGLNDYAKRRADQLAGLGYVAFAADMYGKGVRAKDHEEAGRLSGIYRNDRRLTRERIGAALDVLRAQPQVDPARVGAIGYCFGGMAALELARGGADVKGVVVFHSPLDTPVPAAPGSVKAKVLVLNGADDSFVSGGMAGFEQEMKAAGVDYRLVQYPGAVHSYTVPEAGNDPSTGVAYNAEADRKSWEEMKRFFAELF